VSFSSKLTDFLEYYLASRKVTSFDKFCELLVCYRIKSVLTEGCLKHVLSIESSTDTGWMGKAELTNVYDRNLGVVPSTVSQPGFIELPIQKIDKATIAHLTEQQNRAVTSIRYFSGMFFGCTRFYRCG